MWKPTVRITDEALEKKVKERLENEGRTVQEVVVEFLKRYADGTETSPLQEVVTQPEVTKEKKLVSGLPNLADLPDHLKKPEEFEYYLDYVDYLEKEGYLDCF